MWKTEVIGEKRNANFADLLAVDESAAITKHPLATAAINTAPAIANMIMTPKSRAADKPQAVSSSEHTSYMSPKQDPFIFRLQRDLNSPSAALRTRAIRALKSPNKAAYNNFDVPHAEQSIITADERHPSPPPTLSEILQDVVVYVEVRTGNDNRSEGVKSIIAKMGAQVNDRLLRNTTHVVFKDGLLSTYKRAQSWHIPIVSILWIEACKVQRLLCEPTQFPISNIHMYEYPELYGKVTRVRCMQPDSELNKRQRKRNVTPTGTKDKDISKKQKAPATPSSTPKNDISRFFKPLSVHRHLAEEETAESPATKLLNRMSNGCFTPQPTQLEIVQNAMSNQVDSSGIGDVTREKPSAQKSLSFNHGKRGYKPRSSSVTVEPAQLCTPVGTIRRHSSVLDKVQSEPRLTRRSSLLSVPKRAGIEDIPVQPLVQLEPRMTRRRSSLQLASHSIVENEVQPTVQKEPRITKKSVFQAIAEEPFIETLINNKSKNVQQSLDMSAFNAHKKMPMDNKTNYIQQSMEISPSRAHIICKAVVRRTLYKSDIMDISDVNNENINPYLGRTSSQGMLASVTTQTSLDSFEEHTPVPVFSSTRLPGSGSSSNRRRTLFSVDMELINERINIINNTSQRRSLALANEAELGECRPMMPLLAVAVDATVIEKEQTSNEPKKRRLFTPNDEVFVSPPKSNKKSRQSISSSSTSSTGTVKRRRTLATPRPTAAVGPILQNDLELNTESDPGKDVFVTPFGSDATFDSTSESHFGRQPSPKRHVIHTLVHTNMHKEQVQVIHKAIRKLRGMRLDPTVTKRTTHLVSLEPRRTLNLLRGLMRGVWIVNYKWILESLRVGKWVAEEKYELTSFSRAVEICRTERQAFGITYRCELFRYMETFYVSSLCRPITFNNIKELLLLGSAKITENRYKAKFIIGDKRRAEDDRTYLSPAWVLDSITAMQIQKFGKYLMKCAIVTPYGIRYEDPREVPEEKNRRNQRICYKDPALVINK